MDLTVFYPFYLDVCVGLRSTEGMKDWSTCITSLWCNRSLENLFMLKMKFGGSVHPYLSSQDKHHAAQPNFCWNPIFNHHWQDNDLPSSRITYHAPPFWASSAGEAAPQWCSAVCCNHECLFPSQFSCSQWGTASSVTDWNMTFSCPNEKCPAQDSWYLKAQERGKPRSHPGTLKAILHRVLSQKAIFPVSS